MSSELRKEFYERFARAANDTGIAWAVLSGIEGYPAGIGRDLDAACRAPRDAKLLCETFVANLRGHGFRWIVFPSPIWGRRILGITEGYEAAELHIVDPVRIGWISLTPAWGALEYEGGVFPTDPVLRFFKRCLMPALMNNGAWRSKCAQTRIPSKLPWWLDFAARRVRCGCDFTDRDRLRLFSAYFISNPMTAMANLVRWRVRHSVRRSYPAAPVYLLTGSIDPDAFHTLSRRALSEVFTGFVCVDDYSPKRVKALQAAQRLVFLSKERTDIRDIRAIPQDVDDEAKLVRFVVEEFCSFNERWGPKGAIMR